MSDPQVKAFHQTRLQFQHTTPGAYLGTGQLMYGTQVAYWRTQSTDSNRIHEQFLQVTNTKNILATGISSTAHGPITRRAPISPTWNPSTRGLRLVLSHTARDPDPPVWRPRTASPHNSLQRTSGTRVFMFGVEPIVAHVQVTR